MIKLLVTVCLLSAGNDAACFELASTDQFKTMGQCHDMRERMVRETWQLRRDGNVLGNARCVADLEG